MANLFIEKASATLKEVDDILQERGKQYSDTWGEEACWNLTKAIVEQLTGQKVSAETCRSIALAAFIDQKYSRFAGGYKKDTALDLIGYLAALTTQLESFVDIDQKSEKLSFDEKLQ